MVALLPGCVTAPPVSDDPAAVAARTARAEALDDVDQWSLRGRAALSDGEDGGSGSVRWYTVGGSTDLTFSAPLGRGGFKLDARPGLATLVLDDGQSYQGADVDELLRIHTGWDVPVDALGYWVRGILAPGVGRVSQGADGLPIELSQFGWTVTFRGFSTETTSVPMPRRIEAVRPPYKVKLVVRQWSLAE